MTSAIILLRGRLDWVQVQITREDNRNDKNARQGLISAGRIDARSGNWIGWWMPSANWKRSKKRMAANLLGMAESERERREV